jgi:histidinol dehydrogenase
VEQSLSAYGTIVVAPTMADCADIANQIAPEHLELSVADPYGLLPLIENAGAIFMGHYSPEPLGDYLAGPNHVLPTSGTARFFSPLSVDDFVKKSSLICCTRQELERVADQVILLAKEEGLDAHANSVAIRFGKEIK